ncbi:MAG TPA: TIGR02269 family lipoprotein [Hyalangium sp.]|jgi:uncharacterized lipoprotein (TIGR02269 family)|nr:TIGR02269 family lipoprotein [Hyalangium sp.]
MIRFSPCWQWVLAAVALAACATTPASRSEEAGCEVATEAASYNEVCEQESSLVAVCAGEQCGLYRCREVRKSLTVGRVVLARFPVGGLPNPQVRPQRHWGSAQEVPEDALPVFIIPWRHKPPLLPSQQAMLEEWAKERRKPHEKHHIFPQAFRGWFIRRGINIDEFVIPLEVEKHRSIHRGERGGPWNAAWEKFINEHKETVSKEEIYRYAGQLIYEFQLFGPVVPYWKQPPPLPPGY